MSARSISHWVCNSTSGNWIAWLPASGWPKGALALAYFTERSMQNCAAPRLEAAWRIRFSLKKCCTISSPDVTEQDEAAPRATGRPYPDVPALPASAAGQRPDVGNLGLRAPQGPHPLHQDAGQPR